MGEGGWREGGEGRGRGKREERCVSGTFVVYVSTEASPFRWLSLLACLLAQCGLGWSMTSGWAAPV